MTCVPAFSVPCLLSPCHWLLIALHLRQRPSAFLGRSAWIYQLAAHSESSINFSTGVIHRARQNLRLRSSILILFLSFSGIQRSGIPNPGKSTHALTSTILITKNSGFF